ncbi:MAG: PAS domain S-box protein, partial [Proteobacteria bacterium]|nr:PAS domain S-box protein [Pseudomonadota bacterium]
MAAWVEDLKAAGPGEKRPRVFTVTCKDGTEKIINFISVQMETGVHIMTCEDITEQKRSEEMLLQSRENYRSITDNALNGIYQTTKDGKFQMSNPAFFSMLGYASFEEMATSINEITHELYVNPEDREYIKRILEKEDTIRKFETQFYKKDGSKIWVSINMRNVRDADGTFLHYEGIDEDITQRKQAEIALLESRDKLAVIAEGSAIPQFAIDKDHTVILWNRALEIYSGAKAKDVLGTSNHWKAFYPEKRPCLVDLVIESVTEDEIARWYGNIYSRSDLLDGAYEATGYFPHMKEGTWLYFTAAAIKDSSGNTIAGIETLEDITSLKTVEVSLCQSEAKYRSIFENAVEGIFQSTPEGCYLSVNPAHARIHGYSSPEELIQAVTDIATQSYVNPRDRQELREQLERDGMIENFESQRYRKDGSIFWVSTNARTVRDEHEKVIYYEGTTEDITERKQAEEEKRKLEARLQHADKMESIGTLAGGIAHDFNNLLMGIQGYASLSL